MIRRRGVIVASVMMVFLAATGVRAASVFYIGLENCSDNGPGSAAQPFCTFEYALTQLEPGDTLIIQPGVYTQRVIIDSLAGLPEAPITIRGENAETVIFEGGCSTFPCDLTEFNWEFGEWDIAGWDLSWELDGFISIRHSRHLIISDLIVRNVAMEGIHLEGGSDLVVSGIRVDGTGNAGIIAIGGSNIMVTDNQLRNVQLGYLDREGEAHIGYHEALSIVGSSDFEVTDNDLSLTLKEAIDVKESASNGLVHGNIIEYACRVGIYVNEAQNVRVFGNVIRQAGFWPLDGAVLPCGEHSVYGPMFGEFYGTGILIAVGDLGEKSTGRLSNIAFYQNVIDQTREDCIQFWDEWRESGTGQGQMSNVQIYNNTLASCSGAGVRVDDAETVTIANNIISLTGDEVITGNAASASNISHNLYQFRFAWQTPVGSEFVIGDPLFVDAAVGEFRLQPNSPAVDRGRDMGLPYLGDAPDIGAFEYGTQ